MFSEPSEEEIRAAIAEEDSRRARVAEVLISEGQADVEAKEKNGRQAPLHLCGMNGYAKVREDALQRNAADSDANAVLLGQCPTKGIFGFLYYQIRNDRPPW